MLKMAESDFVCSFYRDPERTSIKTNVNNFAISYHMALKLNILALRSYLKLPYQYWFHSLPDRKVKAAKNRGKNCINVRPLLARHL